MRNLKVGDIVLLREKTSRKKGLLGRVIAIQEGNGVFVRSIDIVVGTNAQKHLGHEFLSDLETNLCYLLKVRMKIILNSNIELKMKYFEGKSVLMEVFYEWTL